MKGIIFDMDGTMIDNMMIHHRAWQQKLAEYGLEMTIEEVKEKIHGVNLEILERLFGNRFTPEERVRISWEKEEAYRQIYKPHLKLITGLSTFLDEIQTAGIPMAIGTAAPPENANFVLDQLQLRSYFKGVFHSGNVKKGKPDPEIFELAADSIGIPLSDCLVFEDSLAGAETARNAGCPTVIITTTHAKEEFRHFSHILKFMADYKSVNLAEIQLLFKRGNGFSK